MSFTWTTEQIMGLSPDSYTGKIGRNLAQAEKWLFTQCNPQEDAIWAEYHHTNAKSVQTKIIPKTLQNECSCGSRKSPCNHVLALLLLWAEQREMFREAQPPEWVEPWLLQQREQAHADTKHADTKLTAHPSLDRAEHDERRLQNTLSGLKELQLWLHDMVRSGFAVLEAKPKNYWELMANRLVDTQAGALGREIRSIGQLLNLTLAGKAPKSAANADEQMAEWPQKLLAKLGRIHFLIQGFERIHTLPPANQADLRAAVGWLQRVDPADPEAELVTDNWLVIGKQVVDEGGQKTQRTWLWGHRTNRAAQIIQILRKPQTIDLNLIVGAEIEGDLLYAPAASRLRADVHQQHQTQQATQFIHGYATIADAITAYAQALSANPWLFHFPIALRAASVHRIEKRWYVRDNAGDLLPLPANFEHGWHLCALGHRTPFALFGEWDGELFTPLTVWQHNQLVELTVLKGVK